MRCLTYLLALSVLLNSISCSPAGQNLLNSWSLHCLRSGHPPSLAGGLIRSATLDILLFNQHHDLRIAATALRRLAGELAVPYLGPKTENRILALVRQHSPIPSPSSLSATLTGSQLAQADRRLAQSIVELQRRLSSSLLLSTEQQTKLATVKHKIGGVLCRLRVLASLTEEPPREWTSSHLLDSLLRNLPATRDDIPQRTRATHSIAALRRVAHDCMDLARTFLSARRRN